MTDPYKVLGVAPGVSNDDIKRAYRELSRKYHPDSYVDNPLSDLAEEKFKEVQEAYQQIMNEREHGYRSTGSTSNDTDEMQMVANYLNARRYREALNVLAQINNRNARWFYYSAVANMGIGNQFVGLEHARQATILDPNNMEYRSFLNHISTMGNQYNQMGRGYGRSSNDDVCDLCVKLWCADSLCECIGGDLVPCI